MANYLGRPYRRYRCPTTGNAFNTGRDGLITTATVSSDIVELQAQGCVAVSASGPDYIGAPYVEFDTPLKSYVSGPAGAIYGVQAGDATALAALGAQANPGTSGVMKGEPYRSYTGVAQSYTTGPAGLLRNVQAGDAAALALAGCVALGTFGPSLDFLAGDGATQQPFLAGTAIYNAATNSTWVTRQRAKGDGTRVASVNVVNHATGAVSSYDAFADLENQDGHGGAVLCRLPSGYWHAIGGVHAATYFKYAVTTTPDDPSSFADQGNILGGTGLALTYPQPYYIDNGLYVFARNTLTNTAPYGFVKASAISAQGVPTFPTTFNPVLDMGANTRTYGAVCPLPNGYEVLLTCCLDDFADQLGRRNVYIAVYNTRTGMVRDFGGTATPTAAPASKAWLEANGCLVVDQVTPGLYGNLPSIALDSAGNPHVAYIESAAYNLAPSAIKAKFWTGSGWSAAQAVYSSTMQGAFNQPALASVGGGVMTMYLQTDSVFTRGGDMASAFFTPGVGWSAPTVIKAAGPYGLTNAVAVLNATPASRVTFCEIPFGGGAIEPTIYGGNIRRYLWGDLGPVTRSFTEDADVTAYFAQFASPPAAGSAQRIAVNDLVTSLKAVGNGAVWPKLDFLYLLANSEKQGAYVNLKPGSGFGASDIGALTFAPLAGVSSAGAGGLSSGFNPSSGTPQYSQNSAVVGTFSLNDVKADTALFGTQGGVGAYGMPRQTAGSPKLKVNGQYGVAAPTYVNRTDGLSIFVRSGATTTLYAGDGFSFASADNSAFYALPNSPLTLFYDNGYTTDTHQVAVWFAGAHLGLENYQVVANIFRRYLKAMGLAAGVRTERQQLVQSNLFSSGFWTKGSNITLTPGVADPFGGTTAFRLQASATSPTAANTALSQAATTDPLIQDTGQSGFYNNNAGSIWVRSDTPGQNIMVYNGSTYTAIPVTSTWTRVSWQTNGQYHTFMLCSFDGSANRFSDIQIYGAQLDPGGTPGVYRATA